MNKLLPQDELVQGAFEFRRSDTDAIGDPINHPSHYQSNGIEVIDFIEAFQLNYHAGNAVKYIVRAGKKDPAKYAEDLKKAIWYLNRLIEKV